MVSATCPQCKILLVEASSNANANLYAAVDTAARLGATRDLEQLWRQRVELTSPSTNSHYNHPGVAITVVVGRQRLRRGVPGGVAVRDRRRRDDAHPGGGPRGWTEAAWSGAGSGCSAYEAKPSWQTDSGCAKRTVADVSAVADPNTGVAVYDSNAISQLLGSASRAGASSAARARRRRSSRRCTRWPATARRELRLVPVLAHAALNDVTSGSNGSCSGSYLCTGKAGYDGPTGLGTPNGTGAF